MNNYTNSKRGVMKVEKLFENVAKDEEIENIKDFEINKVAINSKLVEEGDVFVALNGGQTDGNKFVYEAIANGAKVIVSEKDLGLSNQVVVEDARSSFSLLCKNLNEKACEKLKIIAITGTNGKTTTSHILGSIISRLGHKVAVIGTLGAKFDGKVIDTGFTTPDPDILHKLFYDMKNAGVEYVVMEASAHAIALKKLDGIKFEAGVLTNITQDHLDFFKTMDNYAEAKLSFFDKKYCKYGVVCKDDERVQEFLKRESNIPIVTYGVDHLCDCFATAVDADMSGTTFIMNCFDEIVRAKSQLIGKYNIQNILASMLVCACENMPIKECLSALEQVTPVEGRFNVIGMDNFHVVFDYAHSPDGLENLLKTARPLTEGKLITVFGCGGNRDKGKRPIMGKIASKYSDHVILTSDNPRFEKPMDIIKQIEKGVSGSYEICPDRTYAINSGLNQCKKGDTLIIAGKAGEKYQDINGKKIPYNDFDVVYNHYRQRKNNLGENE